MIYINKKFNIVCHLFQVSIEDPAILKFFGAFAGHVIEFRVNRTLNIL